MVKKNFRMENQMERMIVIFMGMSAAFGLVYYYLWSLQLTPIGLMNNYEKEY
jgi:cell division protein FtsI/penicillin-binding protein 2